MDSLTVPRYGRKFKNRQSDNSDLKYFYSLNQASDLLELQIHPDIHRYDYGRVFEFLEEKVFFD